MIPRVDIKCCQQRLSCPAALTRRWGTSSTLSLRRVKSWLSLSTAWITVSIKGTCIICIISCIWPSDALTLLILFLISLFSDQTILTLNTALQRGLSPLSVQIPPQPRPLLPPQRLEVSLGLWPSEHVRNDAKRMEWPTMITYSLYFIFPSETAVRYDFTIIKYLWSSSFTTFSIRCAVC